MRRLIFALSLATVHFAFAQDRIAQMPGFQEHQAAIQALQRVSMLPPSSVWTSDSTVAYDVDGWHEFDLSTGKTKALTEIPKGQVQTNGRFRGGPSRGRQITTQKSPDGTFTISYEDGNLWIQKDASSAKQKFTNGDLSKRHKFGTGSWVYGEELEQTQAFEISPDSKKVWFYEFDESKVLDYHLAINQNQPQSNVYSEPYPKPGRDNPEVNLHVYDVATAKSTRVPVRNGVFSNDIGHYVYGINWSPDSSELTYHRMNREQNQLEIRAFNVAKGTTRTLYEESNPAGWVEYGPMTDLSSGIRPGYWLVLSERSGFANLYWVNLSDGKLEAATKSGTDVTRLVKVDPKTQSIYSMASGTRNPMRHQLWVSKWDGSNPVQLTNEEFHHDVRLGTSGAFVDVCQNGTTAPFMQICKADGTVLTTIQTVKKNVYESEGFSPVEYISFPSLDNKVTLYAAIHKPRNFDPKKKYPVLVQVYAGPGTLGLNGPAERYQAPTSDAHFGFIVAKIWGRGEAGRGRDFRQALFHKMGIVEIDDQAAGVTAIGKLPYVDAKRVGIYGTSYGGYSTAMCLLRYPNLFAAGSAGSMVSDWRNYDSTYTERYMGLLEKNRDAYDVGSAMRYAGSLRGRLLIYYGTSDDNTHPTNSYQLIKALQTAGKSFEVQVGIDQGHSGVNHMREMEFFIERLVLGG